MTQSETSSSQQASPQPTAGAAEPPGRRGWGDRLLAAVAHPAGRALFALALVLLIGVIFHADGTFFKLATHRAALREASVIGILACGMTLVIICGGIDLSVGSVLGLAAVCFSLMAIHWQWPFYLTVPLTIAVGAAGGLVSGLITAVGRLQPFIATLAMMVFARGLAKYISGGRKISPSVGGEWVGVPAIFDVINMPVLGVLSMVTVILIGCVLISWLLLSRHRWGRQLYAIGGNEEAARLSGVPVKTAKTLAYVLSGGFAAVAGMCYAAQTAQGNPEAGFTYELTAIAVVVIGGTNLMGGRGGIGLTVIGMLTIGYLEKILSINAVPESNRLMLTGAIIVAAVLAQRGKN